MRTRRPITVLLAATAVFAAGGTLTACGDGVGDAVQDQQEDGGGDDGGDDDGDGGDDEDD